MVRTGGRGGSEWWGAAGGEWSGQFSVGRSARSMMVVWTGIFCASKRKPDSSTAARRRSGEGVAGRAAGIEGEIEIAADAGVVDHGRLQDLGEVGGEGKN